MTYISLIHFGTDFHWLEQLYLICTANERMPKVVNISWVDPRETSRGESRRFTVSNYSFMMFPKGVQRVYTVFSEYFK